MRSIQKEYQHHFLLEATKLNKLVNVLDDAATEPNVTLNKSYEVFFKDDRRDEFNNIEDVLRLDNDNKGKIQRLLINFTSTKIGEGKPQHIVQVDFSLLGHQKKVSSSIFSTANSDPTIDVSVKSESASWATRTLAEVEQQVERTKQQNGLPKFGAAMIFVIVMIVALAQLTTCSQPISVQEMSNSMWLQKTDLDKIASRIKPNIILSADDLREIKTMQLRNLLASTAPVPTPNREMSRRQLSLAIPLALIAFFALILIFKCYPRGTFYWGDEVERYDRTKLWRNFAWGGICTILLLSWISNLFGSVISQWLGL